MANNNTWALIDYFDVWGNAEDGWDVNNVSKEFDDLVIADDATDQDIIDYLISIGYLAHGVTTDDIVIEDGGDYIEFFAAEDGRPICRLDRNY